VGVRQPAREVGPEGVAGTIRRLRAGAGPDTGGQLGRDQPAAPSRSPSSTSPDSPTDRWLSTGASPTGSACCSNSATPRAPPANHPPADLRGAGAGRRHGVTDAAVTEDERAVGRGREDDHARPRPVVLHGAQLVVLQSWLLVQSVSTANPTATQPIVPNRRHIAIATMTSAMAETNSVFTPRVSRRRTRFDIRSATQLREPAMCGGPPPPGSSFAREGVRDRRFRAPGGLNHAGGGSVTPKPATASRSST